MGWNGSPSRNGAESDAVGAVKAQGRGPGRISSRARRRLLTALVASLAAICAVVVAFVCLTPDPADKKDNDRPKQRIKDVSRPKTNDNAIATVTPAPAPKTTPTNAVADLGWYVDKAGVRRKRTGKGFRVGLSPQKPLFTNQAEMQLSGIVNTQPGQNFYGDDVPENFEETFAHSLTNRIVINDDDPPDVAEKKQRVIDAKEELRQAWARGENIVEIMNESKREMKKKFDDYLFYERGLKELQQNNASAEELAEYALAAKKVMEAKGIEQRLNLTPDVQKLTREFDAIINNRPQPQDDDE